MQFTKHMRRLAVAAAITSTAIVLPAVALASSGGTPATAPAATTRCLTADLTDWLGYPGSQAAGSTYYELEISNISHRTCTLYGYPGVSAVRGSTQLGSAAGRTPGHAENLLTLVPGSTVHAILQITDVYNFGSACKPAQADALKVYAPGAYSWHLAGLAFEACSNKGPVYLHVSTTIAATGIPGYSH